MQHSSGFSPVFSRPGYLAEVTLALMSIRDSNASGRLSIRNVEQFGLAHLYFRHARLVHVTGDKRDGEVVLNDLLSWSKGCVRFDTAITVKYEDVTWQQAQVFARWLAFLEMRARLHGVPLERLNGLTQSLTVALPVQPLALPQEVAHYEEYSEAANARQWQRFNEGVSQLLERTLSKQQREQLQHVSQSAAQRVNSFVQHAGHATQELTQQALKATQVRAQQAATIAQRSAKQVVNAAQEKMRSVTEVAQHTADHAAIRMEAIPQVAPEEQFQPIIQSTQIKVQSIEQAVSEAQSHKLPLWLQVRSIRHARPAPAPSSTAGRLDGEP